MKKLIIAVLAGFMSLAVGAYAAEDMKKDMKKDPGMTKGEMAKGAESKSAAAEPKPKAEKKAEAKSGDMKDEPKKSRRARRAAKG